MRGAYGTPRPRRSEAEPKRPAHGAREPPGAERDALGTLAMRGAGSLSAPPAPPLRTGAGLGGGIFTPSSSGNFFILPQTPRLGALEEAASQGFWQTAELGDTGVGGGEGAAGQ